MLHHLDPCLMNPLRHGLAATKKYRAKEKIPGKQKVNGALHSLGRHISYRGFARRANLLALALIAAGDRNIDFQPRPFGRVALWQPRNLRWRPGHSPIFRIAASTETFDDP
jgi:hypothetical protein